MVTRAVTTLERTIAPGEVLRRGSAGPYRRLAFADGAPHVRRLELAPDAGPPRRRRSILRFLHLTDAQITDVQSPARVEFLDRHADRRAIAPLLPAYRPHEALQVHALEATLRRAGDLPPSPTTGEPVALAVSTGDAIDNQQWNELSWFLVLMDGGSVAADSGGPAFEGVGTREWDDPAYWHPDGSNDVYAARWGFPPYPGLLDEARRSFGVAGFPLQWLACFGNHEGLIQGTSLATPVVRAIATGDRKAVVPPPGFDLEGNVDRFVFEPEAFLAGPSRAVTADGGRRLITRREFVEAHLRAPGAPPGHGFTTENLDRETAYYVHDGFPGVRFVVLDTANPGGFYQGSIGSRQAAWLEERLAEVHGSHAGADGRPVVTGNDDRLVVICSHHGLETLTNDLAFADAGADEDLDLPRLLAPDVRAMLHRYPNVVLWLSGHTHEHRAYPRPDPNGGAGFWEVSTGAIADWPVQSRVVELVDNGDGTLSIFCTLVDHLAPPDPSGADGVLRLASIHRELAANDPHRGASSDAAGGAADRNVELVLPMPASLRTT
jgi:metallophosphoesterase (TIGR03767 family)